MTKLSFWAGEMMFLGTNSDELSSTLINIVSLALTSTFRKNILGKK
jgi:hypothetical protein